MQPQKRESAVILLVWPEEQRRGSRVEVSHTARLLSMANVAGLDLPPGSLKDLLALEPCEGRKAAPFQGWVSV